MRGDGATNPDRVVGPGSDPQRLVATTQLTTDERPYWCPSPLTKIQEANKPWVGNRPLAFQFQRLRFPLAAVPPL
jgi:hypothetical protein